MKKTNIFIVSLLMLISFSTVSLAFNDVDNHWANETIMKMSEKELIKGYEDGTFKPDNQMTRAEFVTVINRILGLKEESSAYVPDISRQEWYYSEIRKAIQAGIIQGDNNGYVYPEEKITREEAIVIFDRAFHIGENTYVSGAYEDVTQISDWAKEEFFAFINSDYLKGYEDNTLRPKATMTRAEFVTIIERIFPNILDTNVYTGLIDGNVLVNGDNIVFSNVTIDGDLVISSGAITTLQLNGVTVKGNLVLPIDNEEIITSIKVMGETYKPLTENNEENKNYINNDYGISFAIPTTSSVYVISGDTSIDFTEEDLVVIDIKQSEEYYTKNIKTISKEEIKKYANLFRLTESGKIEDYDYVLYDDKEDAQMIVIKRDSIVYTLLFFNAVSENLVDNVLSTMDLFPVDTIIESKNIIYRNSKLSLKFNYKDIYVVVDDSYNTNTRTEENGIFKMFIQVNTITDIQNYNINEIKALLKSLVQSDGEVLETSTFKIMNNDAIKFRIQNEEKLIISLYVVVGNNLYNFIFTGDEYGMTEVGEEMFEEIIETLEF